MFLKHRNALVWVLRLRASCFWGCGQESLSGLGHQGDYETTVVVTEQNAGPWDPTTQTTSPTTETWEQPTQEPVPNQNGSRFWGFVLCFLGLALTAAGVFLFRQKTPCWGLMG